MRSSYFFRSQSSFLVNFQGWKKKLWMGKTLRDSRYIFMRSFDAWKIDPSLFWRVKVNVRKRILFTFSNRKFSEIRSVFRGLITKKKMFKIKSDLARAYWGFD